MRTLYSRLLCAFLIAAGLFISDPRTSSAQFQWPDNPENIKVLPDSVTGRQLGQVMRQWTGALGVRCNYCHVGQGPLTEYDFASDEKEAKEKTRVMMRMTHAINAEYISELTALEKNSEERVAVTCLTCHRNAAKPELLESVLAQTFEKGGIEEVFTHYDELREAYYGGFAYDFREGVLTRLGEQLSQQGNHEEALQVLDKEIELHEEFADVYSVQGQIWAQLGDTEKAIASFEKGKSLSSPRGSQMFQQMIDRLKNQ